MIESVLGSDNYQIAKKLMDVSAARHQAIASNLANLETPAYKRVDVSKTFESKLSRMIGNGEVDSLRGMKPKIETDLSVKGVRGDGNNVKLDHEMMELNKNSMEHEFLTQILSGSLKRLNTAIKGRVS